MALQRLLLALILMLACTSMTAAGDDPALRQQAKESSEAGNLAMKSADSDPSKLIEAAICFAKALKTYEKLGDTEAITEMNANIFWCKKKMNVDALMAYNKRKAGEHPAGAAAPASAEEKAAIDTIEKVVNRKVEVNEAVAYFARADKFAKENPTKYLPIAIRWYEICERFSDSAEGKKAQSLLLEAQGKLTEELARKSAELDEKQKILQGQHDSMFTSKPVVGSNRSAVPSADTQRKLAADLKTSTYKADYAKTRPEDKSAFASKLFEQALKTKDDANFRYVMLTESLRLAVEGENCWQLIRSCNQLESDFTGPDAAELKKQAFQRASAAVFKHALKLLENPGDECASTNLGRNFCATGHWNDGVVLLAAGDHPEAKKLAKQELIKLESAGQKVEVADGWYDLGKKTTAPGEKDAYLRRAQTLYVEASKELSGVSKDRVNLRLTELDKAYPPAIKKWDKLTPAQWDTIKAPVITVDGKRNRVDTDILLNGSQKYRVIPHPTDTWKITGEYSAFSCTWKGGGSWGGEHPVGAMAAWLDTDRKKVWRSFQVIEGKGRLMVGPCLNETANSVNWHYNGQAIGTIRIKVVPVDG